MNGNRRELLVLVLAVAVGGGFLSCAGPTAQPGAAGPVSPKEMASIPGIRDLSFSRDSARIVYASDEEGNWDLYTVSVSGAKRRRLTYSPEAALAPQWSPRGDQIAFISDFGGDEVHDIYVIPGGGGRPERIVGGAGDNVDPHWSPDGKRIAFASDREPRPDGKRGYAIYMVSAEGGEPVRLTFADGDDREPRWSPRGDRIAFTSTRGVGPRESDIYVIPAEGGEAERLTKSKGGAEAHPRWTAGGKVILYHSDLSGFSNIGMVNIESGKTEWVTREKVDQVGLEVSPKGLVAYRAYDRGNVALEFLSLGARRRDPTTTPWEAGAIRSPTWAPNGNLLAFIYSGPDTPSQIWVYKSANGEMEPIVESGEALEGRAGIAVPKIVGYPVKGGRKSWGFLYTPDPDRAGATRGGLVWLHDGPRGQWSNDWNPGIQSLVARGYAVMVPHFRGSTGSGVTFERANDRDWGEPEIDDIEGAAAYLAGEGLAGKGGVAIGGVGYGGFLALITAANRPDRWSAAVSVSGWLDLESAYRRASPTFQKQIREEVGDPDLAADKAWFEYLSPIRSAGSIRCPVLLLSGDGDPLVTAEEVHRMERALEARGGTVEVKVYPNDGRGLRHRRHRTHAQAMIGRFLAKHL